MEGRLADTLAKAVWAKGTKLRNLLFILAAIGLFLLKQRYAGPFQPLVYSYAGNFLVSFALYFNFLFLQIPPRFQRAAAVLLTLACVETFEMFDGFGLMANTYDPFDLLANAFGVGCGYLLDRMTDRGSKGRRGKSAGS